MFKESQINTIRAAISSGSLEIVQSIITSANVNNKLSSTETPLFYAVQQNQLKMVEYFIEIETNLFLNLKGKSVFDEIGRAHV